jgi:hypothetical protein
MQSQIPKGTVRRWAGACMPVPLRPFPMSSRSSTPVAMPDREKGLAELSLGAPSPSPPPSPMTFPEGGARAWLTVLGG